MPYLPLELDGKKAMAKVARASGVSPGEVMWGLSELWEYVWTTKRDTVAAVVVLGCMGPAVPASTLVAFGFLEPTEDGFRVKGAGRLLAVQKARSEAGKKAASNLIQFKPGEPDKNKHATGSPAGSPTGSAGTPARLLHPTPNTHLKTKALRAEKPPADPRHAPLVERLCEAFQQIKGTKYAFGGADGKAVQRLLAQGEPDEIVRRWRLALTLTHPDHSSLVDPKWWNRAAGTGPPSPQVKGALVTSNADWNNRTKSFEEELADGL